MNCSSASTRAVCMFSPIVRANKSKKKKNSRTVSNQRAIEGTGARTYAQKTVEIHAARVERAVEVINRVLDRVIFGDEVDQSVGVCFSKIMIVVSTAFRVEREKGADGTY